MSDKNSKTGKGKRSNKPSLSSSTQDKVQDSVENKAAEVKQEAKNLADQANKTATAASTKASTAAKTAAGTVAAATSSNSGYAANTNSEKPARSWIAPAALLFGLVGTGWSAYLWSQLKSLGENTTQQFQTQAESTKTELATLKTDLDTKATEISASLEEKTGGLGSALEEKTAAITSSLDEKTAALSSSLEEKADELANSLKSTDESLRTEVTTSKEEIATSTASAMQEFTSKTELEINNVSTSFNTGIALLRETNTEKFSELDKKIGALDESVQTTNELASRGQRDWVLAEVNYLLRTGVHRVKLAGDVKAGVIALESASDRLHTLGDINYMPVREQIAEEVAALRRVGPPDIEGLIFKLQHMSKRADTLPLPASDAQKQAAAAQDEPTGGLGSLGASMLNRLKGSVSIGPSPDAKAKPARNNQEKPTKEQLSASDALRLHLQAARLSALRHDSENFMDHMDNAIGYSKEIFDQESSQVQDYVSDLEDIRETPIVPKVSQLGSSLSLFSNIDAKRGEN